MAAYLYNVGKLYLNEQKKILAKIEKENIQQKIILDSFQSNNIKKEENIQQKIILDSFQSNKIKKISEKNVKLISNFSEINIDQLESDSEVETSEDN